MNDKLERRRTQSIVMTALMTALVMSVTLVTKVELPVGYFNLGDLVVIIIACIMPLRISIFAAGVGSALADLMGGFPLYAIFTLFIKIFEVLIIARFSHYLDSKLRFIPIGLAMITMVVLYGFVDVFLSGQFDYFTISVLGNLPQALISGTLAYVLYPQYSRIKVYLRGV